jgi:hypothetical protein
MLWLFFELPKKVCKQIYDGIAIFCGVVMSNIGECTGMRGGKDIP